MIGSDVIKILEKYFVFDRIFDLLDYDNDMEQLYNELKLLKRDVYESNYRFIFLHYDTEYYIVPELAGVTLINLQKILQSLDISNYFCLVLTQQELSHQCKQVKEKFTIDSCSIASITNLLQTRLYQENHGDISLNESKITKKFISLNRLARFHRRVLVAMLKHKNLLEQGIVSYNAKNGYE